MLYVIIRIIVWVFRNSIHVSSIQYEEEEEEGERSDWIKSIKRAMPILNLNL